MQTIEINPLWMEIGGPALLAGLALGALISWLLAAQTTTPAGVHQTTRDQCKGSGCAADGAGFGIRGRAQQAGD